MAYCRAIPLCATTFWRGSVECKVSYKFVYLLLLLLVLSNSEKEHSINYIGNHFGVPHYKTFWLCQVFLGCHLFAQSLLPALCNLFRSTKDCYKTAHQHDNYCIDIIWPACDVVNYNCCLTFLDCLPIIYIRILQFVGKEDSEINAIN